MSEFKEKETVAKYVSSKFDHDLYHEDDDKKFSMIRIKLFVDKKTKNLKWKFFENTKNTIVLDGDSMSEEEINFIKSPEGINFCLKEYKLGFKTEEKIKNKIKEQLSKVK